LYFLLKLFLGHSLFSFSKSANTVPPFSLFLQQKREYMPFAGFLQENRECNDSIRTFALGKARMC